MGNRVCPWYLGYLLANPLRRLIQNPEEILGGHVKESMTVLEVGPGMGFFSLPMAHLAGESGRVVCVDLQERMLKALMKRAERAGLSARILTRLCTGSSLQIEDLAGKIDFALAFAVLHEVPDPKQFLREIFESLRKGGILLLSEPKGHVTKEDFEVSRAIAHGIGFRVAGRPDIRRSHSLLLSKD